MGRALMGRALVSLGPYGPGPYGTFVFFCSAPWSKAVNVLSTYIHSQVVLGQISCVVLGQPVLPAVISIYIYGHIYTFTYIHSYMIYMYIHETLPYIYIYTCGVDVYWLRSFNAESNESAVGQ